MKSRRDAKWMIARTIAIFALFLLMTVPIRAGNTSPRLILADHRRSIARRPAGPLPRPAGEGRAPLPV
jgi:hypothetical protein